MVDYIPALIDNFIDNSVGAAYVYNYNTVTDTWTQISTLTPPTTTESVLFGSSSALANDVLAIGAKGFSEYMLLLTCCHVAALTATVFFNRSNHSSNL